VIRQWLCLLGVVGLLAGCSRSELGFASSGSVGSTGSAGKPTCGGCLSDADCAQGRCAQLGSDSYCLPTCAAACASGSQCQQVTDYAGNPQSLCVPASGACGADPTCPPCAAGLTCDPATRACVGGGGTSGSTGSCAGWAGPTEASTRCHCGFGHQTDCQPNGCYGGWWCDTVGGHCKVESSCTAATGSTSTTGGTTGAPWTGSVTQQGGAVDRLYFAVVGDSRPPDLDDTANYPTAIIQRIYQDIQAHTPAPQFVVSTGDFMFADPAGDLGATQLDLYLSARQAFTGPFFPCLGNHECTGYTNSNCGPGTRTLDSKNYAAFTRKMLAPAGLAQPYYRFDVNATTGAWTAKFLVVAANAWTDAQATWLAGELAKPTTYTFIIRHEPESATTAPGTAPSDALIAAAPYTLKIVGHTHEFARAGTRQVVVGNGGAPITGTSSYGYVIVEQLDDGSLQVSNVDYSSNVAVDVFTVPK
jgi:hypothetical protein